MESPAYSCPHCDAALDGSAADADGQVVCPQCGRVVLLPDYEAQQQAPAAEDSLDARRMKQLAVARRAVYRSRSYCIAAAGACLGAAAQAVFLAVRALMHHRQLWALIYLAAIMGLLTGAGHFARLAIAMGREARRSHLKPPTQPPDFTPLGDGSQRAANLEKL